MVLGPSTRGKLRSHSEHHALPMVSSSIMLKKEWTELTLACAMMPLSSILTQERKEGWSSFGLSPWFILWWSWSSLLSWAFPVLAGLGGILHHLLTAQVWFSVFANIRLCCSGAVSGCRSYYCSTNIWHLLMGCRNRCWFTKCQGSVSDPIVLKLAGLNLIWIWAFLFGSIA